MYSTTSTVLRHCNYSVVLVQYQNSTRTPPQCSAGLMQRDVARPVVLHHHQYKRSTSITQAQHIPSTVSVHHDYSTSRVPAEWL